MMVTFFFSSRGLLMTSFCGFLCLACFLKFCFLEGGDVLPNYGIVMNNVQATFLLSFHAFSKRVGLKFGCMINDDWVLAS